jgi:hypothetical protein
MSQTTPLKDTFAALRARWMQSGQGWNDEMRTRFEREYWAAIQETTTAYLTEYERTAKIAAEASAFAAQVRPIRG